MTRRRINKGKDRRAFKKLNAKRREARALLELPDTWPENWILDRLPDTVVLQPASRIILKTGMYTVRLHWDQKSDWWTGNVDEFEDRLPGPHVAEKTVKETLKRLKSFIIQEIFFFSKRCEVIPNTTGDGLLHISIHDDAAITQKDLS